MKKTLAVLLACLLLTSMSVFAERPFVQQPQVNEFLTFGEYDGETGNFVNLHVGGGSNTTINGWNDTFIAGVLDMFSTTRWYQIWRDDAGQKSNSLLYMPTENTVMIKKFDEVITYGGYLHISFDLKKSVNDRIYFNVYQNNNGNNVNAPLTADNKYLNFTTLIDFKNPTEDAPYGTISIDNSELDDQWHKYNIYIRLRNEDNTRGCIYYNVYKDGVKLNSSELASAWNGGGIKGISINTSRTTGASGFGSCIDNLYVRHYMDNEEKTQVVSGQTFDQPKMAIDWGNGKYGLNWGADSTVAFSEVLVDKDGNPYTPKAEDFKIYSAASGLEKPDFYKEVKTGVKDTVLTIGNNNPGIPEGNYKLVFENENVYGKASGASVNGTYCYFRVENGDDPIHTYDAYTEPTPSSVNLTDCRIYEYFAEITVTVNGATKSVPAGNYPITTKDLSTYTSAYNTLSLRVKGVNGSDSSVPLTVFFAKYNEDGTILEKVTPVTFTVDSKADFDYYIYDINHPAKPEGAKVVDFSQFGEDTIVYVWNGNTIKPYSNVIDYTTAAK